MKPEKIILGLALVFILSTVQAFEGGSGTSGDPYQISNCQQLQDMQNDLDAEYILVDDINCESEAFSPIGTSSTPFSGTLNGNPAGEKTVGYEIEKLSINSGSETGLFGSVSGQVANFTVSEAEVEGGDQTGVLAGKQDGGLIKNVRVESGSLTSSGSDIGGLVGRQEQGSITYSYADVNMSIQSANNYIGGFLGYSVDGGGNNNKAVSNLSSGGSVVGGFIGRNDGPSWRQSFTASSLGDPSEMHGFGPGQDGTGGSFSDLSSSYFDNSESELLDSDAAAGEDYAEGLPTENVTGEEAETRMTEFNFGQEWASANEYPIITQHHFAGGAGTSTDPYEIETCQQLQNIQESLHNHYEITENIDCSNTEGWGGGNGFEPIGDSNSSFTGSLTGNYNFIENLYIERPSKDNTGLIGFLNSGEINQVRIRNSYVSGNQNTGGLMGNEDGGGQIINSSFQGEVYGAYRTGGLAGHINQGSIIGSYTAGYVDNAGGSDAGGLLGALYGNEVRDSYSTAIVNSGSYTGGLIGAQSGSVIDSYSAGEIINEDRGNTGGLVGAFFAGSVDGSYWDINQSGTNSSGSGEGLTTTDMIDTAGSNMNFDFVGPSNTWTTNDFYYPKLEWQENGINGDADDPYMIENCHQLQFMNQSMTSSYQLANNIDCSLTEEWNEGKGFRPVGNSSSKFDGNLYGDNKRINNLQSIRPNQDFIGLFGDLGDGGDDSQITNFSLIDYDIEGDYTVGGVAGRAGYTDITDVAVTGKVTATGIFGGVVGNNAVPAEIIRSKANATVSGSSSSGGIAGWNDGLIRNAYAEGKGINGGYQIGGLVGKNGGTIETSYSISDLSDSSDVGGLVAADDGGTVTDSYWDVQASNTNVSANATGLYTYEMTDRRAVEYMEGLNFTDTWVARDNDRYPELAVFTNESGFDPNVDQPPGLPTLLNPGDGEETLPLDPNLTAELYHPQGESMSVDFIREDGSSIDSDSGNSLDSVYSVWNSRDSGTNYNWSMIIEDSSGQTLNVSEWINDWSFTTIYGPDRPGNPDPADGEFGHPAESNLSAFVSQDDGEQIFNDLYFTNDSSDSRNEFDLESSDSVSGSGDADYDPESFYSGLENGTQYFWYVNSSLTDSNGNTLWNSSSTWNFTTYESPEPDQVMPSDGVTGIDPQPDLNVSVDHPSDLTVDFYDYQSHTQLGSARIEDGNWANISTDSFSEYSKSQTHYWYVDIETDNGETWNNNDSAEAYGFTVSNVEDVNFDEKTENDINLDPGTADFGQETLRAEVSTPNDVTMEEIAFNISNSTDYEVTGNSYDVESGDIVTANISQASIVQEDNEYDWNVFYREGSNVLFESSDYTFSTYVAALSWVPTAENYEGGVRETIKVYYNESDTSFDNFSEAGSIDYGKINDTDSLRVANSQIDSGDQACYNLTVVNLVGESGPEGDCIGGVP